MKKNVPTGILWGLSVLFAGLILRYAFVVPFEPGAIRKAIPERSSFSYKADSLDELLVSPVSHQLANALESEKSIKTLLEQHLTFSHWAQRVMPSEVLVASLPQRYPSQRKPWIFSSWIGWRSPWLRWKLESTKMKGLKRLDKYASWPVWQVDAPELHGASLTFSLTDTLFIACLSDNPSDITILINTYDKRIPSLPQN